MTIKMFNAPNLGAYTQQTQKSGTLDARWNPSDAIGESTRGLGRAFLNVGEVMDREIERLDKTDLTRYEQDFQEKLREFKKTQIENRGQMGIDDPNGKQKGIITTADEWFKKEMQVQPKFRKDWNLTGWNTYLKKEQASYMDWASGYQVQQEQAYKASVLDGAYANMLLDAQNSGMDIEQMRETARLQGERASAISGLDPQLEEIKALEDIFTHQVKGLIGRGEYGTAENLIGSATEFVPIESLERVQNQLDGELREARVLTDKTNKENFNYFIKNTWPDVKNDIIQSGNTVIDYEENFKNAIDLGYMTSEEVENEYLQIKISSALYQNYNSPSSMIKTFSEREEAMLKEMEDIPTSGQGGALGVETKNNVIKYMAAEKKKFNEAPIDYVNEQATNIVKNMVEQGNINESEAEKVLVGVRQELAFNNGLTDRNKITVLDSVRRDELAKLYIQIGGKPEAKELFLTEIKKTYGDENFKKILDEIGVGMGMQLALTQKSPSLKALLLSVDDKTTADLTQGLTIEQRNKYNSDKGVLDNLGGSFEVERNVGKSFPANTTHEKEEKDIKDTFEKMALTLMLKDANLSFDKAIKEVIKEYEKDNIFVNDDNVGYFEVAKNLNISSPDIIKGAETVINGLGIEAEGAIFVNDGENLKLVHPEKGEHILVYPMKDKNGHLVKNEDGTSRVVYKEVIFTPEELVGVLQLAPPKTEAIGIDGFYAEVEVRKDRKTRKEDEFNVFAGVTELIRNKEHSTPTKNEENIKKAIENIEKEEKINFEKAKQAHVIKEQKRQTAGVTKKKINNKEYGAFISKASAKYGVDEGLIAAVMGIESANNPNAVSKIYNKKTKKWEKGAYGLMQLMPGTAKDMGVTDSFDPQQNIDGGARYLAEQLTRYKGNTELALMAYNWGFGNVNKWLASGKKNEVPTETRNYIKKMKAKGFV